MLQPLLELECTFPARQPTKLGVIWSLFSSALQGFEEGAFSLVLLILFKSVFSVPEISRRKKSEEPLLGTFPI